jgi:hypothetical protein
MPPFTSSTADIARITNALTTAVAEVHETAAEIAL